MKSLYGYCGMGLILMMIVVMYTMLGTYSLGYEIDYWMMLKAAALTSGFFGLGFGAGRASNGRSR